MIREPFAQRSSPVHRLDPRVKLVGATVYSFVIALSMQLPTLLGGLCISLLLVALSRYEPLTVARRLGVANGFIFFLWLVIPWTFKGDVLFQMGPFPVTREGLLLCARITIKSNVILLGLIALVSSMPLATLGYALDRLHVPSKIVNLLLITYRYIFVIGAEYQRLARAATVRGFRPGTNGHTYKTYAYLLGMLFVRALARGERVQQAMLCRGFRGRFFSLSEFTFSRNDWIGLLMMAVAIIGLVTVEWVKIK